MEGTNMPDLLGGPPLSSKPQKQSSNSILQYMLVVLYFIVFGIGIAELIVGFIMGNSLFDLLELSILGTILLPAFMATFILIKGNKAAYLSLIYSGLYFALLLFYAIFLYAYSQVTIFSLFNELEPSERFSMYFNIAHYCLCLTILIVTIFWLRAIKKEKVSLP
jgi:hypothetical protein